MNSVAKEYKMSNFFQIFIAGIFVMNYSTVYANSNISKIDAIEGNSVSISILDKITAKVIKLDIPTNSVFYYKEIEIKPKKCFINNHLSNNSNSFSNGSVKSASLESLAGRMKILQ